VAKPGFRLVDSSLVVDLGSKYTILSTVSGLVRSRYIVFHHVGEDFEVYDVDEYRRRVSEELGLPSETPVFITAVEPGRHVVSRSDSVMVIATVGLRPPVCVEQEELYDPPLPGTTPQRTKAHSMPDTNPTAAPRAPPPPAR
jgi:adenosylcobinamide amidohydrolase